MRRLSTIFAILIMATTLLQASPRRHRAPIITNVDPPHWWVGMANDTLQLLISGNNISDAKIAIDYPGVELINRVTTDSPNYLLLYLKISDTTKPGRVPIIITTGHDKTAIEYELRARNQRPEDYIGFDASDVLYLVMPDRFAQGKQLTDDTYTGLKHKVKPNRANPNARHGGDIEGIRKNLDYLEDLGVTAVWVCPVLENDMPGGSYHGYATTNYYRIDPRFGTNQEWTDFVAEAQNRGIRVVMDMIFNHSGVSHPWMSDMPMKDWYNHPDGNVLTNFRLSTIHDPYVSDYDLDHTVNGWFVPSMPDLNQRNPHVMKYLTQNSIWWIEESKINGIRMDTYPYADMHGMAQWAEAVMEEYPNFNIVGECWYGNEAGSAYWQQGNKMNPTDTKLPTVMDFKLSIDARKMFNDDTNPWNSGLNIAYDHLSLDYLFPDPSRILTFLDNHDSDRFLLELPENLNSWKQAQTFLLTSRGIPQIYYGTELLMNGSKEGSDGFVRQDFPGGFPDDTIDAFTPDGRTDLQNEAYNFISKLLRWRRDVANDVIAQGSLKHFMPQTGVYIYERKLGDKQVVVMMNGKDEPVTMLMNRTLEILPIGATRTDMLTGQQITINEEMTFEPRQILILQNF